MNGRRTIASEADHWYDRPPGLAILFLTHGGHLWALAAL